MISADRSKPSFVASFCSTAGMSARQIFDGGLLAVWGEYLIRAFELLVLTLVWRALAAGGADLGELPLPRLLTYSLMASCLCNQLDIWTPATSSLWEGSIVGRYTRPMPVIASFVAETIGRMWIPGFVLYSLPLLALSSFVGISPAPASPLHGLLALVSLSMSVAIGFALDFLFAAFAMFLKNGCSALPLRRRRKRSGDAGDPGFLGGGPVGRRRSRFSQKSGEDDLLWRLIFCRFELQAFCSI